MTNKIDYPYGVMVEDGDDYIRFSTLAEAKRHAEDIKMIVGQDAKVYKLCWIPVLDIESLPTPHPNSSF